jgi:hypothetical protein
MSTLTQAERATMSPAVAAYIAGLEAKANAARNAKLTMKVTTKKADGSGTEGALSVYGMGRFPVTLYRSQWERLFANRESIEAFIAANADTLATKD